MNLQTYSTQNNTNSPLIDQGEESQDLKHQHTMDQGEESQDLQHQHTVDQGEEYQDLQQKQATSYQLKPNPQEPRGTELILDTAAMHKQNPESSFNQEHQVNQQNSTLSEVEQKLNSQSQEIQDLQKHQNEFQAFESKELQVNHEPKMQQQEMQYKKNQKPHTDSSHELQTQQSQKAQKHTGQILQGQQISTIIQPKQPLSAPKQSQKKEPTQQASNCQLHEKHSKQWHQDQQLKKRKKKLVGENQERINYLVQASKAIVLADGSSTSAQNQRALASQLGSLARAVGRRCVLRLAPSLKRCMCKGCGTALVFGVNAKVRHRKRRQKHLVITCLTCHTIKRFLNNPRHQLWFEQEEAVL